MIYLFTGNSDYLIKEKIHAWKKLFIEKNGDFNLVHFQNIGEVDNNVLTETLLSEGFMGEKKLIIIDDFPGNTLSIKNKKAIEKQDFLTEIIHQIPESNILIFSSPLPDKRSKFYKLIKKEATKIEEFNAQSEVEVSTLIQNKYGNIFENGARNLLLKYKSNNLEKIISETEKLLITKEKITSADITKYIKPELEESIFQLINDILNLNIQEALSKMKIILEDTNVYAFYNNLGANIRTYVYISKLKSMNIPISQISTKLNLGNKAFLVQKKHKISNKEMKNFYINLIQLDKKMKSGKLLGTEEKDFIFEIEKCIIKLHR